MHRRRLRLREARTLSPTVRELSFAAVDGAPLRFEAGQFWNFYLPTATDELKRSYSLCAAPTAAGAALQIAVTLVRQGEGSRVLHALSVGDEVEADGPHGLFAAPAGDVPLLFVAAGTGLSPLRAMLQERLAEGGVAPIGLLFGCRTPSDVLWGEELTRWQAAYPTFSLHVTLSRPPAEWQGPTGYVQAHVKSLIEAWPGPRPQVLICGLSALVRDVRRVLKEDLGYDRRAIHSERYD